MVWLYIWLGVVVVSMIVEFITMELVSIWITIGSLVAMILAACKVGYEIQIITMVVISIACLFGLRKVTMKFLNRNKEKTNTDLIIGEKAKLLEDITKDSLGLVKINGISWSCKSEDADEEILKGNYVIVEKIEGNKLIVKKVKEEEK